jgi:hypothetical protein
MYIFLKRNPIYKGTDINSMIIDYTDSDVFRAQRMIWTACWIEGEIDQHHGAWHGALLTSN